MIRTCEGCIQAFKTERGKQRFCSLRCSHGVRVRLCEHCRVPFKPRKSKTRFCSHECSAAAARTVPFIECARCGGTFRASWRNPRFCSTACRDAEARLVVPEPALVAGARWVPLTHGRFALVDEADAARVASHIWRFERGYARSSEGFLHRFILGLQKGDPGVDHRNRDKLDNRRSNLRSATDSQNSANVDKRPGTSSKYKGVSWAPKGRGRWVAAIMYDRRSIHIGQYTCEEEAGRAYDAKARELFGDFALFNFPT